MSRVLAHNCTPNYTPVDTRGTFKYSYDLYTHQRSKSVLCSRYLTYFLKNAFRNMRASKISNWSRNFAADKCPGNQSVVWKSNMAVLAFCSEYKNKTLDDILRPKNLSCPDFGVEECFSFPPVADVSITGWYLGGPVFVNEVKKKCKVIL